MNRIELNNRKKCVQILKSMGWDAMPVENKACDGTPDLNASRTVASNVTTFLSECVEIWIELKIVEEWPKRKATPIKIPHFSPAQKAWLKLRIRQNQNCYIIVQIEEEHLLYLVNLEVIEHFGSDWNKEQMYENAMYVSTKLEVVLNSLQKGLK